MILNYNELQRLYAHKPFHLTEFETMYLIEMLRIHYYLTYAIMVAH